MTRERGEILGQSVEEKLLSAREGQHPGLSLLSERGL